MEIIIDTVDILKNINQIRMISGHLRDNVSRINSICFSELPENWKSSAYDKNFAKKMDPFVNKELESFLESIECYQGFLENYLNGFQAINQKFEGTKIPLGGI